MSTAVLDIGKTNVKLTVIDGRGEPLHQARRPNAALAGPPYPHHDVDGIWEWLVDSLGEYSRAGEIESIVTTTHGATAALMARDDLALPVLDYEYDGVESRAPEYEALRPSFSETASPLLPVGLNLGRQIHWLAQEFPEAFARVTDILPYPQYWAFRLCGLKATEVTSLGCHTDLWNPAQRCFSSLVAERGWDRLMPAMRRADEVLATVRAEVAEATGLSPETRVICGIHDSNASYYCHRAVRQPPFSVVSSGTWTICMAAGSDPARLIEAQDMLANVDVFGEPVPCARFMGGREFAAIAGRESDYPDVRPRIVTDILHEGPFALPSFAPQGGPFRSRRGRVLPAMPEGAQARVALGAIYCALVTDHCFGALGASGDLVVEGSLARNTVYLDVLAALRSEQRVIASVDATGTTLGAARLAGGKYARPADADGERTVAPEYAKAVTDYRDRWRELLMRDVDDA